MVSCMQVRLIPDGLFKNGAACGFCFKNKSMSRKPNLPGKYVEFCWACYRLLREIGFRTDGLCGNFKIMACIDQHQPFLIGSNPTQLRMRPERAFASHGQVSFSQVHGEPYFFSERAHRVTSPLYLSAEGTKLIRVVPWQ